MADLRGFVGLLLASLGSVASSSAAPTLPPPPRESATSLPAPVLRGADTEILKLEDAFAAAIVKKDRAAIERLLAKGFVYSEDDKTLDRETVIHELLDGGDLFESAVNEEMRVHRFGETSAVTGWLVLKGHGASGPFERRYRFTDTWVRRDGRWRLVAAHDYLVPAGSR